MLPSAIDVRAVPVPRKIRNGLTLLLRRELNLTATADPQAAVQAGQKVLDLLLGATPAFGDIENVTADRLAAACDQCGLGEVPARASFEKCAELLRRVAPYTPICSHCGSLPLSNIGGKISALPPGSACPFCENGIVALVPMVLRTIAWTDGRLVEPQTDYDLRSVPGEKIPLGDELIVEEWAGGLSPRIARALSSSTIGPAAFLAYCNLRLRLLPSPLAAREFLASGNGLDPAANLHKMMAEAAEFMQEREITNIPPLPRPIRRRNPEAPRFVVDGRTYLIEGLIGQGDKSHVYRAFWDNQPTEAVVIKFCADMDPDMEDAALLAHEAAILRKLAKSEANGAHHFTRIIPQVVAAEGVTSPDGTRRQVTVFRYKNLHDWTLADVLKEYPEGVDPETAVWMWKRMLMLLGWTHLNDIVHAAVLPQHILIQPLNHAATLLDWSYAVRDGEALPVRVAAGRDFYPKYAWDGGPVTWITDIIMSARCMIAVLGGDPATGSLPAKVPAPIAGYLRHHGGYGPTGKSQRVMTAIEIEQDFGKVAESVFGPRRYHPFAMPRRSR